MRRGCEQERGKELGQNMYHLYFIYIHLNKKHNVENFKNYFIHF